VPHSSSLHSTHSLTRCCATLVILLTVVFAQGAAAQSTPHLRVFDRDLKALLERGMTQSPTLNKLVAEVEAMPLLVFVECSFRLPSGVGARTNFVTSVGDTRFLRVGVDCGLTQRWQVSLLAHEIQHALEIGRHRQVMDVDAMESLYENIGFPTIRDGSTRHFETDAAIAVQRAVHEELAGRAVPSTLAY
jgi:hypothetical protein